MKQEIRVQIGDTMTVIPPDDALVGQIQSLIRAHLQRHQPSRTPGNQPSHSPGGAQNLAAPEDMPLRIIIGPSQDSCPCCGRPYDEKTK